MGEGAVFDVEFMRWLAQLGVGGMMAGVLFYFYRKDVRAYTDLWKEQATLNANQTVAMMALVEKNTIAITSNTDIIKSLHRRMDRLDILRFVPEEDARSQERKP